LAGREFEVIPLPGVTCGQVGLATTLSNGCRIVFCAEAIHSPGRLARIAPLQYNYNDLSGAIGAYASARRLSELNVDALLPSLGEPMLDHCEDALSRLRTNIEAMVSVRPWGAGMVREFEAEDLEQVTEHVWLDRKSVANTWFLVADSGKVMAIDYGYDIAMAGGWPGYPKKDRRRALLHGLKSLEARVGARRIDVVLVSHFHDDHVAGIPVLQRLHGTECWAPANFAELLEHPEAHTFPCGWPFPITVQRKLDLDQTFEWEGFVFHLAPMSGHTRFSALIGFEADGKRFAHTGDQYFFGEGVESFEKNSRMQNHVYRNGALLDGYEQSGKWMLDWRPDIVLQGHQPPMFTDEHFFRHIAEWSHDYADLARDVMPLGDDETHFNLDSWGGWIWPYRIVQDSLEPFTVEVTVRNPLPYAATLAVELQGPIGWSTTQETLFAGPRREVRCQLTMTPNARCRRQPIAVSLVADGKPFGQVAEALVTIGNGSVW
ncbi:MAG: MBL fold metallo-hydrolase, partial [Fimbriimonas sp.]|nr:MBL fold metallo-hydrolase [Fimbriimonas sp.]